MDKKGKALVVGAVSAVASSLFIPRYSPVGDNALDHLINGKFENFCVVMLVNLTGFNREAEGYVFRPGKAKGLMAGLIAGLLAYIS